MARAAWDQPAGQLLVVGKRVREGESDRRFEVIDAHLLLTVKQGRCLLARVPLGELTRVLPEATEPQRTAEILELTVQPLGAVETLDDAVAIERVQLPGGPLVLLVHLMRDVQWGLTERHVVPVSIDNDTLIAGQRVQVGRDSMGPPVYYGVFQLVDTNGDGKAELVLTREGMGRFAKQVVLQPDATGAVQATEQAAPPAGPPVSAAERDGRDVAHALHVCGPGGARSTLSSQRCPDGSSTKVRRLGSVGMADDGHLVDRYESVCGTETKDVHVDIYHCPGAHSAP